LSAAGDTAPSPLILPASDRPIHFEKMHGAGNDFVVLDLRCQSLDLDGGLVRRMADRSTGVGCDQILVLRPASGPRALGRFEVWNADGSRAEQCGNGVRCLGLYLQMQGETPDGSFALEGPVAEITLRCLPDGQVRVRMGQPDFRPGRIPLDLPAGDSGYQLELAGRMWEFDAVSMGNPHAVIEVPDVAAAPVTEVGPLLSRHPAFPQGCNVGFVQVLDSRRVRLRVLERGAGETRACGSGACAAVAVLRRRGKVEEEVLVEQAGGRLIIGWDGGLAPMDMTGPAVHVFTGTWR